MSTIKTNQLAHTANGASVYTLPQTDGSAGQVLKTDGSGNLSWVTPATSNSYFSVHDQWALNQNITTQGEFTLTDTHFSRSNSYAPTIGAAMSVNSNGYWTFPTTGIWRIKVQALVSTNNTALRYSGIILKKSTNGGSSFDNQFYSYTHFAAVSGATYSPLHLEHYMDVTSTTDVKLEIRIDGISQSATFLANDEANGRPQTKFFFTKVAET
ncbi:MAG: hypothetical protein CMG35_10535 [Candidatus Marinimicrobia bacterium]|nr:hypothetical protein [Candidatus Neomarinimicrobiota bacterium]|tara:strand:+ start:4059 stop:4694 length:636 start_codon:yes stop_codon:yes gene_type:complete